MAKLLGLGPAKQNKNCSTPECKNLAVFVLELRATIDGGLCTTYEQEICELCFDSDAINSTTEDLSDGFYLED